MAVKTDLMYEQVRVPVKAAVLSLAAVVVLASSAVAQTAGEDSPAPEPQSNRISVRVAEVLDNDPEAILRFVADAVRYEPYAGLLRDDAGTFFSMAGNSIDQAALLRTLLGAADIETRFAVGPISEDTAAELLASSVVDAETHRATLLSALGSHLPGQTPADASLPTIADAIPFDEGATSSEVTDWARRETEQALALIDETLAGAGIAIDGSFATMPTDEIDQHTWVQALIDGAWSDLDPSLPGIAFGDTLGTASETMTEIPAERTHMVDLAVLAETVEDGALATEELLRVTGTAAELAGAPIIITNIGGDDAPELARGFEKVLGLTNYHPVIGVDGSNYAGGNMSFKDPASEDGGGLGGGFFDAAPPASEATAEWIEVTVTAPGRDPALARRVIFDRIGDAARDAGTVDGATLPTLATVDLDEDGREEPAALHWASWVTISTGVPSLLAGAYRQTEDDQDALAMVPFTHQLATTFAGSEVAAELGVRPFVDAPNITALTALVDPQASDEDRFQSALDIWHRSHGVVPMAGGPDIDLPAAVPGVISHVTERAVAGEAFAGSTEEPAISVGAVMGAATDQDVGFRAIDTVDLIVDLPYESAARSALQRSVHEGWVAIVPDRSVTIDGRERVGWWLVDPVSGRVSDQMDDGRGISVAQTAAIKIIAGGIVIVAGVELAKWAFRKLGEARKAVETKVKSSVQLN